MKHIENNVKLKRLNKFEGVIKAGRKIWRSLKKSGRWEEEEFHNVVKKKLQIVTFGKF